MTTESKDGEEIDDPEEGALEVPDEEPPEVEESSSSGPDEKESERPGIDDDEFADLDSIADDLAGDDGDADEDRDGAGDDGADGGEETTQESDTSRSSSGRSWGRMYRKNVVKASEILVDDFGDEDSEPITEEDVKDFELDESFNEFMVEKTGRPEDIPPGQWVAIGTVLLLGMNIMSETDLARELLSGDDDV